MSSAALIHLFTCPASIFLTMCEHQGQFSFFSKTKSGFLSFFGLGECQIHGQIWFSNTTFVSRHWWARISWFLHITNKPGVHKYILWKVMDVTTQWGKFKVIQIIWKIFQKLSMAIFCRKLTFEKSTYMTHQIKKVL